YALPAVPPGAQPARTTAWIAMRVSFPPDPDPHPAVAAPIAAAVAITSKDLTARRTSMAGRWFPDLAIDIRRECQLAWATATCAAAGQDVRRSSTGAAVQRSSIRRTFQIETDAAHMTRNSATTK